MPLQYCVGLMFLLFNDGHVLQLWSETVAVHRWMIYNGHMITGDQCGPNYLTFVLQLTDNEIVNACKKILYH